MLQLRNVLVFAILLSGALFSTSAATRMTNEMSFHPLATAAELVVIADASAPEPKENTDQFMPKHLQQLETRLNVHAVIKGAQDKRELPFVHFRYKEGSKGIINGPQLLEFQTETIPEDEAKKTRKSRAPKYLLFLKRRVDGKYEAVSGQMDPIYSAFLLSTADGKEIEHFVDPTDPFLEP